MGGGLSTVPHRNELILEVVKVSAEAAISDDSPGSGARHSWDLRQGKIGYAAYSLDNVFPIQSSIVYLDDYRGIHLSR